MYAIYELCVIILRFVLIILQNVKVSDKMYVMSFRYGKIQRMFVHFFWPDDKDAPSKVVIQAEWYEQVGTNPVNGLPEIRLNRNFDASSLCFLEDCVAHHIFFVRSDPFTPLQPNQLPLWVVCRR